jgi:hypothetical protein
MSIQVFKQEKCTLPIVPLHLQGEIMNIVGQFVGEFTLCGEKGVLLLKHIRQLSKEFLIL